MFPVLVDSLDLMNSDYPELEAKLSAALDALIQDLEEAGYDPPETVKEKIVELQKAYDDAEAENFEDSNDDTPDISDVEEDELDISDVDEDSEE